MVYIVRCSNSIVTDYYLDVVGKMFEQNSQKIYKKDVSIDSVRREDLIVTATILDFIKVYRKGFRNIYFWMQGIEPEESYLKHHSICRKKILDFLCLKALKKSTGIFYVSEAMRDFIDSKFRINTTNKSFIMPCLNIRLYKDAFYSPQKYKNNIFAYVGSLSEWQCFGQTMQFYKMIEDSVENTKLRVYTQSADEAKAVLKRIGIKNYTVGFVEPDHLAEMLSEVKFGFVLRDDIAVNQVATPTKLSSYLASGVIPVFSDCIRDFAKVTSDMKYVVRVQKMDTVPEKVFELCKTDINCNDILNEYEKLFSTYYCVDKYIKSSKNWLASL